MCIENNLISLNGRTKGDLIGQFTCNTYNGASVVDYVIVSQDLFPFVQSFSVHYPTELTHHSCLSVVMRIETPQEVKDIMRLSNHPGYMIWNENKKEKLQNVMLSEKVKHELDSLFFSDKTTNSSVDINKLVSDFSQILRDTSKNILLTKKQRKHANKNTKSRKKWYNESCYALKRNVHGFRLVCWYSTRRTPLYVILFFSKKKGIQKN